MERIPKVCVKLIQNFKSYSDGYRLSVRNEHDILWDVPESRYPYAPANG